MRMHALMVLAVGLLIAADTPKEDAVAKEMAKFQGTWKFLSMEVQGKPDKGIGKYTVVFKGDQWTVSVRDKVASQATIKLDPTSKPKTIDLTLTLDPYKGKLIRGIYALEGDKLTVCDRAADKGERPTEFASKADSGLVLVVLQRVKP
ncbi:MAG: TIGR03067 domain-containing protein [Gemmataceae bacterium]